MLCIINQIKKTSRVPKIESQEVNQRNFTLQRAIFPFLESRFVCDNCAGGQIQICMKDLNV